MKIDRSSYKELLMVWLGGAAIVWLSLSFLPYRIIAMIISFICLWFMIFLTYFFRIPRRKKIGNGRTVTSVADGEIVIIEKTFEPEFLKKDCIQVSVYMNFFDMHANFWPVTGDVTYYQYHPGKHLLAFKPKASEENEHSCVSVRTADGNEVFFKQLAGGFARRIVCYAESEKTAQAGDQCGIIKFGSRIDMFLPLDSEIKVQIGQITRACETIIAELPHQ